MLPIFMGIVATTTLFVPSPTLQQEATRIALEHGISPVALFNLIDSESDWQTDAKGDHGCSIGLTQINTCAHTTVTKEQAFDPEFNLEWAATQIAKGNGWWWTAGNCYALVQTMIGKIPLMKDILPNSEGKVGDIAIFTYKDRETGLPVKHIAYVTSMKEGNFSIREANLQPYLIDDRIVDKGDPHIVGFMSVDNVLAH